MQIVSDLNYSYDQSGYSDYLNKQVIVPYESWAESGQLLMQILGTDLILVSSAQMIRYLTSSEQASFDRALRRSVQLVYKAKSS